MEVWHGSDRLWRYRFLHPEGVVIRSNRGFVTRQEAEESAEVAYPGVPVVELSEPPYAPPARHRLRRLAMVTVITTGVGLIVAGAVKLLLFVRGGGAPNEAPGERGLLGREPAPPRPSVTRATVGQYDSRCAWPRNLS